MLICRNAEGVHGKKKVGTSVLDKGNEQCHHRKVQVCTILSTMGANKEYVQV